jgi:UDP-N-acetylmuramyl tripeptide synthase
LLRSMAAIVAAKIIMQISRWLGNQGTDLPGRVARWIDPAILGKLAARVKGPIIVITGTNGKTTTSNMAAHILQENGSRLVHNQAGANMVSGITAAFIKATNLTGTRTWDYALLETDEANVAPLLSEVKAQMLLVTNFFRDQLDRYGELDHTIGLIKNGVTGQDMQLLLNADDPLMSSFPKDTGLPSTYYGFAETPYDVMESSDSREGRYCMICGEEIEYLRFHFAQLGIYRCPHCGNRNPAADFTAADLSLNPQITMKVNELSITSPYQGFYNAYNILAAVTLSKVLGVEDTVIQRSIAHFEPRAGRMERFNIGGRPATLVLVKNPTGFNQSVEALLQDSSTKNLFMALNDNAADGRDISWIWDADLEVLGQPGAGIMCLVCSGLRSGDMAVRLKYAGIDTNMIQIESNLEAGIKAALSGAGEVHYILSTYTALFQCQKILRRLQSEPLHKAEPRRIYENP